MTPAEKLAARIPIPWDDVERIASAAHERFNTFAHVDAKNDEALAQLRPLDAMQVRLAAWQARNFGVPTMTQLVCGVVEELGEWVSAESESEAEIDAAADVAIYLSQLLTMSRLSLSVIDDAAIWAWHSDSCDITRGDASSSLAPSILAHVALKHEQRIRGLDEYRLMRCGIAAGAALVLARLDEPGDALLAVAPRVLARDWVSSPTTGGEA